MRRLMSLIVLAPLAGFALTGCGQGVSGAYLPTGSAPYQQIEFSSGDTVDLTVVGMVRRGTYKVDGKKVVLTVDAQSIVFTLDDKGCLDGGSLIGTYCKK